MRVFVPMSDEWINDPEFAKLALIPYRCGVPLARREATAGIAVPGGTVAEPSAATPARAPGTETALTAVA